MCLLFFQHVNTFEQDDFVPYITFENTLGGGGIDIANDVIELSHGYLLVGAAGPECDIIDAVSLLLDKVTGQAIQFNHYGKPNEGNEDNFFDVEQLSENEFVAAGFTSPKIDTVPYNPAAICRVYDPDYPFDTLQACPPNCPNTDGNIFFARFDSLLNIIYQDNIESVNSSSRWDAGYKLSVENGTLFIAGAWHGYNGVLMTNGNGTITDSIVSDVFIGEYRDINLLDNGEIVLTGFSHCTPDLGCPQNTEKAIVFTRFANGTIHEKSYNPPGYKIAEGESISLIKEDGFLIVGTAVDFQNEAHILLMRIRTDGTEIWTKVLDGKGRATDAEEIEDGFVITGDLDDDLFFIKIDIAGNIIWTEKYDYLNLGNKQGGKAIISTSDGGFLAVGNSFNNDGSSSTMYVVKTDANGKVK